MQPEFHHGLLMRVSLTRRRLGTRRPLRSILRFAVHVLLWRISNHLSLAGDGALRTPGRWHTRGRRVVYCAQSPAAALLEILVHFEIDIQDLPVRYRLLKIETPDDVQGERLSVDHLPTDWLERTEV